MPSHAPRLVVAVLTLLLAALAAAGCSRDPAPRQPGPLRVVVSIPPLAGLTRPLFPDDAALTVIVPPGQSEHGYELTPRDVSALAAADVVVYVGLGLDATVESFLQRHPSPTRQDVCFATAVGLSASEAGHHHDHDHGDHDHDHHDHGAGEDPHLWLDPELCLRLLPAIRQAADRAAASAGLSHADAAQRESDLAARIRQFDEETRARLAPFAGQSIVTHHAAWERFAGHYGLKIAAVLRRVPTSEAGAGVADEVLTAIRASGARAIFIEPQFDRALADRIAQRAGVHVGVLDPLGDGDWLATMRANAEALARSLGD